MFESICIVCPLLQRSSVSDDVSVRALHMAKTVSCRQSIFWFT